MTTGTTTHTGWHTQPLTAFDLETTDFAAYLARSGKPTEDVNGEWPVRS